MTPVVPQAHVYELRDKEGRLAPIVLKATRRGALISDNKREWATGQRLGALGPGDAPLPGIMKIGPAVCRGRKRANSKGSKLMGMRNLYVLATPSSWQHCSSWRLH